MSIHNFSTDINKEIEKRLILKHRISFGSCSSYTYRVINNYIIKINDKNIYYFILLIKYKYNVHTNETIYSSIFEQLDRIILLILLVIYRLMLIN